MTGDSACGPATVKFLDLEFIGNSNVMNGERIVAIRQSYQQEPKFLSVTDEKVVVITERKSSTIVPMLASQHRILNFTVSNLRNTWTCLPLVKCEEAEIEAPVWGKVFHTKKA
jgi:hypothetical protein